MGARSRRSGGLELAEEASAVAGPADAEGLLLGRTGQLRRTGVTMLVEMLDGAMALRQRERWRSARFDVAARALASQRSKRSADAPAADADEPPAAARR